MIEKKNPPSSSARKDNVVSPRLKTIIQGKPLSKPNVVADLVKDMVIPRKVVVSNAPHPNPNEVVVQARLMECPERVDILDDGGNAALLPVKLGEESMALAKDGKEPVHVSIVDERDSGEKDLCPDTIEDIKVGTL